MPSIHLAHSVGNFRSSVRFGPWRHQTVGVPLVLSNHPLVRVSIYPLLGGKFLSYFRPSHLSIVRVAVEFRLECCHSVVLRSYSVVDGIVFVVVASNLGPAHLLSFEK